MKSKRAEEFINNRSELIDGLEWMVGASTARRAVELAELDAEEEIEMLKARAVEAYCEQCGWYEADGNCSINEDKCPKGCEYANQFIQKLNER